MSLISAAVVSAMAAQNIGAGRWDRIGRITGYGMGYLLLITGLMVAVILLFHAPLLALFLGRNEAAIAAAWHMPPLASWSFVLFGRPMNLFGVMPAHGRVWRPPLILAFTLLRVRLGFHPPGFPPLW